MGSAHSEEIRPPEQTRRVEQSAPEFDPPGYFTSFASQFRFKFK